MLYIRGMTSDIFIYDQIGGFGFFGEGVTLKDIQEQLNKNADSVTVHINSNGGDVREGFAIHDFLASSGKKITTVIEGKCYSIATVIFLAGSDREMQENAELMIHNPWGMAEGDANEIEKYADWIRENEDRLANFYVQKTGQSLEDIRAMMAETTFMDAEKAIEKNFATKKVEPMKAVALINNNMKLDDNDKNWFESQFSKIEKLFKPKAQEPPKSMVVKVADGSEIFIETEDETLQGKKVFKVSEGQPTEEAVENGDYTLEDGRVITVADGVITDVQEMAENKEVDELKARIAELEAENETFKAKATEHEEELKAEKAKFEEVQASLVEMKNRVFGQDPPIKPITPKVTNEADAKLQAWAEGLIKQNQQ